MSFFSSVFGWLKNFFQGSSVESEISSLETVRHADITAEQHSEGTFQETRQVESKLETLEGNARTKSEFKEIYEEEGKETAIEEKTAKSEIQEFAEEGEVAGLEDSLIKTEVAGDEKVASAVLTDEKKIAAIIVQQRSKDDLARQQRTASERAVVIADHTKSTQKIDQFNQERKKIFSVDLPALEAKLAEKKTQIDSLEATGMTAEAEEKQLQKEFESIDSALKPITSKLSQLSSSIFQLNREKLTTMQSVNKEFTALSNKFKTDEEMMQDPDFERIEEKKAETEKSYAEKEKPIRDEHDMLIKQKTDLDKRRDGALAGIQAAHQKIIAWCNAEKEYHALFKQKNELFARGEQILGLIDKEEEMLKQLAARAAHIAAA